MNSLPKALAISTALARLLSADSQTSTKLKSGSAGFTQEMLMKPSVPVAERDVGSAGGVVSPAPVSVREENGPL